MRDGTRYFVLVDGDEIREVPDFSDPAGRCWAQLAVDRTGTYEVSTIFIGNAMGVDEDGRPLTCETMVFADDHDDPIHLYARRYATVADAKAGHGLILDNLTEGRPIEYGCGCPKGELLGPCEHAADRSAS